MSRGHTKKWAAERRAWLTGLVLTMAMQSPPHAADWLGTTSNAWEVGANWNPAGEPTGATAVNINVAGVASPFAPVIAQAGEMAGAMSIGTTADQSGMLTVTGAGRLTAGGSYFVVGDYGTGTLTVSAGGQLTTTSYTNIGNWGSGVGTATVTGPGSKWTIQNPGQFILTPFYVGDSGTGTLTIEAGGEVEAQGGIRLGNDIGAAGTVTVKGAGSTLTATAGTFIGYVAGSSGKLTITDGADAALGTVTVAGTTVFSAVAGQTTTGELVIEDASTVTATSVAVGSASSPGNIANGMMTVSGETTTLAVSNQIDVGAGLAGNTATGGLTITGGANVTSNSGRIGTNTGSTGSVVVAGVGSAWTTTSSVTIGAASNSGVGTLEVLGGASASFGSFTGYNGADVTIDGEGSSLVVTSASTLASFTLGGTGAGNTLTVSGGAALTTRVVSLSTTATSGMTVLVDGAGTQWTSGNLTIGGAGTTDFTVDNGAALTVNGDFLVSGSADTRLTITGGASVEQNPVGANPQFRLGRGGDAELMISDGGILHTSGFMFLARGEGTVQATITGPGSKWTWDDGTFIVGSDDDFPIEGVGDAHVYVLDGGELGGVGNIEVAGTYGSTSSLTVSGAGSKVVLLESPPLTGLSDIGVGHGGHGTMIVENGAYVRAQGIGVGAAEWHVLFDAGPPPTISGTQLLPGEGYLRVSGAGTKIDLDVTNFQTFDAGADGGTGLIEVLAGAEVKVVGQGHFGQSSIYQDSDPEFLRGTGTLTVSGVGSKVTYTQTLDVGEQGEGILNVLAGGYVSNGDAYIGSYHNDYDDSHGVGVATVGGAGSQWVTAGLRVGDEGEGTLNVLAGGKVTSTGSRIGGSSTGTGTATVDGTGSLWAVTGTLQVGNSGTGTLILKNLGALTVSGAMTIGTKGTVRLGDGGLVGTLAAAGIANNGAMWLDNTGSLTLSTPISGTGTIAKSGSGTVFLTGTSTFTGATTITGGRLHVNGTLPGPIGVDAGGLLGGNGSTGAVTVASGGRIAPGNSIDTLTVASAGFASGSVLETELADDTRADLLQVTGTATISSGASVFVMPEAGTYAVGQRFRILTAGTRTGAFGSVADNSAFLTFALDQAIENEVWLELVSMTDFISAAETANQIATAGALDDLASGNDVFDAVALLDTAGAQDAFDQLSGEIYATTLRVLAEDSRWPREAALDRVDAAFAALRAGKDMDQWGRNLWARTYGALGEVEGDGNAAPIGSVSGGLVVGADGLVADHLFLGVLAGVSTARIEAEDRSSEASATSYSLGLYGGYGNGALKLKFGGVVSGHSGEVNRSPSFPGFSDDLGGDVGGTTAQVFGEVAYAFELGDAVLEPFARLAAVRSSGWEYSETGGDAALSGETDAYGLAVLTAGLRGATEFTLGDGLVVEARGMLGIQRTFGGLPATTHGFAGSDPFTVVGAAGDSTAAIFEAGIATEIAPEISFDLTYTAAFGTDVQSGALKATLTGQF